MELYSLPAIDMGPNYGGDNEGNGDLPQKIPGMHCCSPCPQPCSRPPRTHAFTRDSRTPTDKSPVGSLFLSPGSWCTRFCYALQESISQSYVSCGSSMVGLMVTSSKRAYAIPKSATPRAPVPGGPLLTHTSTGDTQTQFCVSLCGVPGSWCAQGLSEPSEHLWQQWGLILTMNSPLLPSCWGFSFVLGCGVSPPSCSSAVQLPLQPLPSWWASLPLDLGYLLTVAPVPLLGMGKINKGKSLLDYS